MYFLGIDPGYTTGGWAILDRSGAFVDRGENGEAMDRIIRAVPLGDIRVAGLELITSQGRDLERRHASANLRESFGYWKGVLDAWGIRTVLWAPATWQSAFDLIVRGRSFISETQRRTFKKRLLIERAKQYFPEARITLVKEDGQAAALLLAYYTLKVEGAATWTSKRSFVG